MSDRENLKKVGLLLDKDKAEEAREEFNRLIETDSVEYFLMRGRIEQQFQNWGEAINAYNKVLDWDPENNMAKSNLHLIQNILNFWNPEMFNP